MFLKLYFIPNVAHIGQEVWKVWVEIFCADT